MPDSAVFFPLRSNVEWFEKENRYSLKSRIKEALLLYDKLFFEAGSYICGISEKGNIDIQIPPAGLSYVERKRLNFVEVGGEMSLSITNNETGEETNLIEDGKVKRFWGANFLNLFEDLGFQDYDFLNMKSIYLNKKGKEILKDNTKTDLENFDIEPQASGDYFLKKKAIEGLNHSLMFSSALNEPILVDDMHEKYLRQKSKSNWQKMKDLKKVETFESILSLTIPDFSSLSVDRLIELREDRALKDFREKIKEISNESSEISNPKEFCQKTQGLFVQNLLDEINEMAPDKEKISLDILLGLIPYSEPITIAKDAYSLYKFSQNWISFIMSLRQASS